MKVGYSLLGILLVATLLVGVFPGCAPKEAPVAPEGIQYEVCEGAKITQVSWYISGDASRVKVEVENTSPVAQRFVVGVNPDDTAFWYAGMDRKSETLEVKEVAPGEKSTYTALTVLTAAPERLIIRVESK